MCRSTSHRLPALLVALLIFAPIPASAQSGGRVVFEDTFETASRPEWSIRNISATPKGQRHFLGELGAETVELKLKSLPPHRMIRVSADLLMLRSWDGNDNGNGPDAFLLQTDDRRTLFAATFGNFSLQTFPGWYRIHSALPGSGARERNTLGYTFNGQPMDAVYPVECVFPHGDDSLELRFMMYGNGHMMDESWGLDNVRVTVDDVPAPSDPAIAQAWDQLASEDAAIGAAAVRELVAGVDRSVTLIAEKVRGQTLSYPPPGMDASTVRVRPRSPDAGMMVGIVDPTERQLALAAHVLSIIGSARATEVRDQMIPRPKDISSVRVVIKDAESGAPIPHLPMRISATGDPSYQAAFTGDEGELNFESPPGMMIINYSTPRHIYVPMRGAIDFANARAQGRQVDVTLDRAISIGGMVVDLTGKPVAGATVKLQITAQPDPGLFDPATVTDAQGRWSFEPVPVRLARVAIGVFHPDYAIGPDSSLSFETRTDLVNLRNKTVRTVVANGIPIEGVVLDPDGKPIPDAWVDWGNERGPVDGLVPSQSTDAQGRFRFTSTARGRVILTVKATGYNVVQKMLIPAEIPTKVEFTLHPSKKVVGKIVTTDGTPIYGARVYIGTWKGASFFDMGFAADRQGRFTWDSAPDEAVLGSVSLPGFPSRQVTLQSGPQENVITLTGPMIIRGTVVDAETNAAINGLQISYALLRQGQTEASWQEDGAEKTDGAFELRIAQNADFLLIRAEAKGYLPTNSEPITLDGTAKQVNLKLFSAR